MCIATKKQNDTKLNLDMLVRGLQKLQTLKSE